MEIPKEKIKTNVVGTSFVQRTDLVPFQGSLKREDKTLNKKLQKTIIKRGFDAPIFVWSKDGRTILDGHQRLIALEALFDDGYQLEDDAVPVVMINAESEEEAKEKVLEYNSKYSEFSMSGLEIFIDGLDLDFLSIPELDDMDSDNSKSSREDDMPSLSTETRVKKGDVFLLGDHRVMCGDSTSTDVKILMGKQKAQMLFTDPPYNMDFQGSLGSRGEKSRDSNKTPIMNDNMSDSQFDIFLDEVVNVIKEYTNGAFYICFYRLGIDVILNACNRNGLQRRNVICRYKPNYNLSNSDYKSIYEPIIYGRHGDHTFYGYTVEQDVWQFKKNGQQPQALITHKGIMFKVGKSIIQIKKTSKKQGEVYELGGEHVMISVDGESDVREVEKTKMNDLHPTMKPVALCERAIRNSTDKGDIVLDLFGGSGTTLIACEKMKRRCYMMEMSPEYVQVIIERYKQYTEGSGKITCENRDLSSHLQ